MIFLVEDEDGVEHEVRCNEEGDVAFPHILHQTCPCLPDIAIEDGQIIIIHNEMH